MTRPDPFVRQRLRRLLEAGEALRAAAEVYGEALEDAPVASAGLSVGLHGDEPEHPRTIAEAGVLIHAELLADLVERLTGVVDARTGEALADVERALVAELAPASSDQIPSGRRGAKKAPRPAPGAS